MYGTNVAPLTCRSTMNLRRSTRVAVIAAALLLAGCEGTVTTDLATEAPADPEIEQVVVSIIGVEFLKDDGDTETLAFSDSESVNLADYSSGDPLRLFTDEQLPEGDYTGVRLRFDEEQSAFVDTVGGEFPIVLADGEYAGESLPGRGAVMKIAALTRPSSRAVAPALRETGLRDGRPSHDDRW